MKITFVGIGWEQLGISLLSAIAKQYGHSVGLAFSVSLFNDRYNFNVPVLSSFFDDTKDVLDAIEKQQPDVLVFSPLTCTYQWMLAVAVAAKQILPNLKVVFGGVHVSAVPELVISREEVDFVCVGEGDIAFPMILQVIEKRLYGKIIPNTRYKLPDGKIIIGPQTGFIQDLDSLPIFDKPLWEDYMRLGDIYFTLASRGCPNRCSYCFNSYFASLHGNSPIGYVRHRSPEHMLAELRFAKKRYRLKIIEFEDDVFTLNKRWLKEFLYKYKKEIGIPFQCLSHPLYMNNEVARLLADAGCIYVQMGVQSMHDGYKRSVLNRYETQAHIESALNAMRRYNIKVKLDHMFGLPDEPMEAQELALKVYMKYRPFRIQTFWTNFLPGTEMFYEACESGLITETEANLLNNGINSDFYRNSAKIKDQSKEMAYYRYEACFKLIQALPPKIMECSIKLLYNMPIALCRAISFFIDIFSGLIKRNPDHIGYAKYYLFHIIRFFLKKIGIEIGPATRVYRQLDYKDKEIECGQYLNYETEQMSLNKSKEKQEDMCRV